MPKFSEEPAFNRDVQVVLDENYINYWFFTMFYHQGQFSLSEYLFSILPDDFGIGAMLKVILNTNIFQYFFAGLKEEFGLNKRIDFKCGFNKEYLNQGHLHDTQISRVYFKENDIL